MRCRAMGRVLCCYPQRCELRPRSAVPHRKTERFQHCTIVSSDALEQLEASMLGWAITFLIVALIAAVLGFGGIAEFAVDIARIIFFVAIILFVISAVVALIRGR